ncbi:MAG: hypothetical protein ACLR23_20325 [Clostridia bacterium]|uniref:hypothetical protein n=1 Tax=Bianquea renquensis TaxID=2763661 RepID=UPI002016142E|nr:hypothetical protein [Bianquea renquensis]
MSIEPWNTGTGGTADCEDMPRKSVDIRLTEHPVQQKRGLLRPFPAIRRGRVRAAPEIGSRGAEHPVDVRFAPTGTECRRFLAGSQGSALSPRRAFRNQYLQFSRFI